MPLANSAGGRVRIRSEEIYEGLESPEALTALNRRIARALDAQSWTVGWIYNDGVQVLPDATTEWSGDLLEEYARDYAHLDPWTKALIRNLTPNRVTDLSDLVPDHDWTGSVVYNEFFRSRGVDIFRAVAVGGASELGMGCFAFHCGKRVSSFSRDRVNVLSGVSRDLSKMLAILARMTRTELTAHTNSAIANSVDHAILLVDFRGRVLQANEVALGQLRTGKIIAERAGRLEFRGSSANRASAALAAATGRASVTSTSMLLDQDSESPLIATFTPKSLADGRRCALLWLSSPLSQGNQLEKQLQDLFGLTRAEALVAEQIASGQSPKEIAEAREATVETVRTQIKSIFAKLGCTRQTEVCALLNRLPRPMSHPGDAELA